MGTTLTSCSNECGRHGNEQPIGWLHPIADNNSSNRFSAEVYRLSADKSQWVKIHPKVLSIKVNNYSSRANSNGNGQIALLEATALCHQQQATQSNSPVAILSLPINEETQLKRYTDKFVYWYDNQARQVFALNLVSPSDLDLLCSAMKYHPPKCLPSTTQLMGTTQKIGASNEHDVNKIKLELAEPPPQPILSMEICCEQLRQTMLELVQSESAFVRDLHMLLTQFVLPSGLQFLQCVRELHRIHSLFLVSLEKILAPMIVQNSKQRRIAYGEIKPLLFQLCALFIAKCAQFKVYSDYTFAHLQIQQVRKDNTAFNDLIGALSAQIGGVRVLESLMIKPVQRLLKYPLFIGQLREFCLEGSQERSFCAKALKQMRTLADWLNEMQRIKEEYGAQLLALSSSHLSSSQQLPAHLSASADFFACNFADLNSLHLFAHVRWLNRASMMAATIKSQQLVANHHCSEGEEGSISCVFFVFQRHIVILERKSWQTHHQHQNGEQQKKMSPIVMQICHVKLLIHQRPGILAPNQHAQGTAGATSSPSLAVADASSTRFALAVLSEEQQQAKANTATAESKQQQSLSPACRLYHFESCHPEVCRHLALILRRQRQLLQREQKSGAQEKTNADGQMQQTTDKTMAMMASWRMETSIDSSCSSSLDRGYASGGAVGNIEDGQLIARREMNGGEELM